MIFSKIANYYISRRNAAIEQSRHGRIAYIDLIKGILIISVIYRHSVYQAYGTGLFNNMVDGIKMPAFMCISFLFFKEYSGFADFSIRKICKLMIPFIFVAIFDTIIYLISHWGGPHLNPIVKQLACITDMPTWFLYALFICYIEYYIFHSITSRFGFVIKLLAAVVVSFISYFGLTFNNWTTILSNFIHYEIIYCYGFMFCYIPLLMLPLFVTMQQLRTKDILYREIASKTILIVFIISLIIWVACAQPDIEIRKLDVGIIPLIFQADVLALTAILLCIGRAIKWLPVISYMGRYSIIVFIVHSLFMSFKITSSLDISCITQPLEFFSINCIVSLFAIPIFRKYLPCLCAQKDLFTYNAKLRKIQFNNPFSKESKQP